VGHTVGKFREEARRQIPSVDHTPWIGAGDGGVGVGDGE
jgi:hypothetical protein